MTDASGIPAPAGVDPRAVTTLADAYVDAVAAHNPIVATSLGIPGGADRMPDLSPEGAAAEHRLRRETLARLDATIEQASGLDGLEAGQRRCARLLRERLEAAGALHEAGEDLRSVGTLFSPLQSLRSVFLLMPLASVSDWETVQRRLQALPEAVDSYRRSLAEGLAQDVLAGPRQVEAVLEQVAQWLAPEPGGWFSGFVQGSAQVDGVSAALQSGLAEAATAATAAVAGFRSWLGEAYLPAARSHGSDVAGEARYRRWARYWTGAELDLHEVYAWGWQEYARLDEQLRAEAGRVRPGASVREAMTWLDTDGPAVEGVEEVRAWLQRLMDDTITALDGTHLRIAGPIRQVEAMIAPEGSAAAPYYTRPSLDFSRPGRTWLPTLGRTRFPEWDLISTWYHEGVPGHHLQLAQWVLCAEDLSRYQVSLGSVGANVEGWALYAERLMDELGFLSDPGHRLGYLDAQQMRAVRVIIDIGMHLELPIPVEQGVAEPFRPGQRWTPETAREFFGLNSGRPADFLDSEIIRYLGMPGQAISYKLGERAWVEGRQRAADRAAAEGRAFDAVAWHDAALSAGSLGLDDLVDELASS
ncbi:MAG: DUF885 domain-containing protein [Kineosporiaceae bacterium]